MSGLKQPVFSTDVKLAAMRDPLTVCVRSVLATAAWKGNLSVASAKDMDLE